MGGRGYQSLLVKILEFLIACIPKPPMINQITVALSLALDSSTDAIGGWTKNTPKPDFFEKRKKSSKFKNSKVWFPLCFERQNQPKKI